MAKSKFYWHFICHDNSGKKQSFRIVAGDKDEAIRKGMERARKNAKGDICPNWSCRLIIWF